MQQQQHKAQNIIPMNDFLWTTEIPLEYQQIQCKQGNDFILGYINLKTYNNYKDKIDKIQIQSTGLEIYLDQKSNIRIVSISFIFIDSPHKIGLPENDFIFLLEIMRYSINQTIQFKQGSDVSLKLYQMYAVQKMYAVETQQVLTIKIQNHLNKVLYIDNNFQCTYFNPRIVQNSNVINQDFIGGGLILDDVGLGKTIQMLALIQLTQTKQNVLIIAPRMLIPYWIQSFNILYSNTYKSQQITNSSAISIYSQCQTNIYFISKSQLVTKGKKNSKKIEGGINQILWDRVIVDESQAAINNTSQLTAAIKTLKSKIKWFLSATPTPNNPVQVKTYQGFFNENNINQHLINQNIIIIKRTKEDIHSNKMQLFVEHILIQVENKIKVKKQTEEDALEPKLRKMVKRIDTFDLSEFQKIGQDANIFEKKSKYILDYVNNILPSEDFLVIVCNFVEQVISLKRIIGEDRCLAIHGEVSQQQRDTIIQQFGLNPIKKVLIMTIFLGEVGLNLQMANHMILIQPQWNNSSLLQVMGRIYRTNQKKSCYVKILVSSHATDAKQDNNTNEQFSQQQPAELSVDQLQYLFSEAKSKIIQQYDISSHLGSEFKAKKIQQEFDAYQDQEHINYTNQLKISQEQQRQQTPHASPFIGNYIGDEEEYNDPNNWLQQLDRKQSFQLERLNSIENVHTNYRTIEADEEEEYESIFD